MILTAIYGVGYLWFWRYFVGWFFDDFDIEPGDSISDILFCVFMGTVTAMLYPIVVPARMVARAYYKWAANRNTDVDFTRFFPAPKSLDEDC